jgi:uncharacterized protein (UPF0332 family)
MSLSKGWRIILRKQNFLHELFLERKIQVVNPSEEISGAYLRKSESHLASAKLLRDHGHFEEAVSLAYYSMYHSVMALFFRTGIKCENHSAAIILLKEVYSIDSSPISTAKRERIDTQYYIDTTATEEDVRHLIRETEAFNDALLDSIERITNEKIVKYREKLRSLVE